MAHQLWGATKSCINENRYKGSIESIHIGKTGQPGIGHALGHNHGSHRDSSNDIHLQQEHETLQNLVDGPCASGSDCASAVRQCLVMERD